MGSFADVVCRRSEPVSPAADVRQVSHSGFLPVDSLVPESS